MKKAKIYLEFSKEVEEALLENGGVGTCVKEALEGAKIDEAEIMEDEAGYQNEFGVRDKDIVTIILVSTAALAGASISISHLISSIRGLPTFVVYNELEPIVDNKGKILCDSEGKPIMRKIKKFIKKDPQKNAVEKSFEVGFSLENGLVIKFTNSEKDNN